MPTITDDFSRADGALGANWHGMTCYSQDTGLSLDSELVVSAHQVVGLGSSYNVAYRTDVWANDHISQVTFVNVQSGGSPFAGVAVRFSPLGGYFFFTDGSAGGNYLRKIQYDAFGGVSYPDLGPGGGALASFGSAWADGDTCKLEAVGTTINIYRNGVLKASVTDASFASGAPGLMTYGTVQKLASWSGTAATVTAKLPGASFVNCSHLTNATPGTVQTTTRTDTRGASAILLFVSFHPTFGGNPIAISSVTDSLGNAWTLLEGPTDDVAGGDNMRAVVYYCKAPTTGKAHTFTVTFNNACTIVIHAIAVAGTDTINPIEAFSAIESIDGTVLAGSSIACTQGAFVFAIGKTVTQRVFTSAYDGFVADPNSGLNSKGQYQVATADGNFAEHQTIDTSDFAQIVIVSLRAATSAVSSSAGGNQENLQKIVSTGQLSHESLAVVSAVVTGQSESTIPSAISPAFLTAEIVNANGAPAGAMLVLFPKNTEYIELVGLKDETTGNYVNDALLTATLYDKNNQPVTNAMGLVSSYVGGSNGKYRLSIPATFNPPPDYGYTLVIDGSSQGRLYHVEAPVKVAVRKFGFEA